MRIEVGKAVILCKCGKKHQLIEGLDALVYWCGNELKELKTGDCVIVKEE